MAIKYTAKPSSTTLLIRVLLILLIIISVVSVVSAAIYEDCVLRSFAPPPLPWTPLSSSSTSDDHPDPKGLAKMEALVCRGFGRNDYIYWRATGEPAPRYVAALKEIGVFKNNETALNDYISHEYSQPPSYMEGSGVKDYVMNSMLQRVFFTHMPRSSSYSSSCPAELLEFN